MRNSDYTRSRKNQRRQTGCFCGCIPVVLFFSALTLVLAIYFFAPFRTTVLLLGIDIDLAGGSVSRSDTIILSTFMPSRGYTGLLSIPRDLWVDIPGIGENRVNTAHFYGEAALPGGGPYASIDTIKLNFGVSVDYFARINFNGIREVVNALGGVEIELDTPMAGYDPGIHHLTGNKALAFARNRAGSDDFFRMKQGQILISSIFNKIIQPASWPNVPSVAVALKRNLYTNIPTWQWPRLAFTLLRAGLKGFDSRTIEREMVTPFTTDQGAMVLLPNWELIKPLVSEMFGRN